MIRSHRLRHRFKKNRRSGAAAVEAALVLPLLVLINFGAVDTAQYITSGQVVCNASREGARIAARDSTTSVDEVTETIEGSLQDAMPHLSIEELRSSVVISVTYPDGTQIPLGDLTNITSGDPVRISVSFDFDCIRWLQIIPTSTQVITTFCRRD